MTTWDLAGTGTEALSTGTTQLFAQITTLTPGYSAGDAFPTNFFRIGAIRFSVGDYVYPPIYFDAEQQVIDVPPAATGFAFEVGDGGAVRVNEGGPPAPPGMSLITTPVDGSYVNGNNVQIAWSGIDAPLADDYIGILATSEPSGSPIDGGWCYGGLGWCFASSCDTTPATGPIPSAGSCTNIFYQNVPVGTLCNARYRRNADDSDVIVSASFVSGS